MTGDRTTPRDLALAAGGAVAVVVVDMQRDFCSSQGAFAAAGVDISANERIVAPLSHFVNEMRDAGALIVWIRQLSSAGLQSPAIRRRLNRNPERRLLCQEGSAGAELAVGLSPQEADVQVTKYRYSAFFGSSLDSALRSAAVGTVVLTGTAANACVDSTARDAAQLDYDVIVVQDLVGHTDARLGAAALENLDRHFAVVCGSADVLRAVSLAPPDGGVEYR